MTAKKGYRKYIYLTSAVVALAFALTASLSFLSSHKVQADCSPATNNGTDTLSFSTPSGVTSTQNYVLWTRVLVPASTDTVQASIDGGTCYSVGGSSSLAANTWTWVNYASGQTGTPIQVSLTPGSHTLKYYGTAANTGIDKILLLTSGSCTPTGNGSNCEPVAPTISLTANPSTVTQGSIVALSANVTDSGTVSSVVFYDGSTQLGSSSTANPYIFNWQTSSTTNTGTHSITAHVTDSANGTTVSSPVTVTVNAPVTTPGVPNPPTGVKASATSPTSVSVSWNNATLASGTGSIGGYYVLRGGVNLTPNGVTTTSYTDSTALPNTTYSYSVEAYVSAGKVSAPSTSVSVTTPPTTTTATPTQPTITSSIAASPTQINLAWSASTETGGTVTGYNVYVNSVKKATTTATSFGLSGLTASTKYSIYVQAVDGAGNVSKPSTTVTVTTPPVTSTGVITLSGVVSNSKTGAPIYHVYVATGPHATAAGTESTYTNSSGQYVLSNLIPAKTHFYIFIARGYRSAVVQVKLSSNGVKNIKLTPNSTGRRR